MYSFLLFVQGRRALMRQLLAPILEKFPVYLAEVRMFFRKHPTFCVGGMMSI